LVTTSVNSLETDQFFLILDTFPMLFWVKDSEGRYLYVNSRCQEIFGVDPQIFLGKTEQEIRGEAYRVFWQQDQEVMATGHGKWFKFATSVGEQDYWLETYKAPLTDASGQVTAIYGFTRDITAQVETEVALRASRDCAQDANRAKTDFLASMNHELRTPLNAIIGFAELATVETKEARTKTHLREIVGASQTLLALINDIMDMVKLESNQVPVSPVNTRLWDLGEEITSIYRQQAGEKGLKLVLDIAADVPSMVVVDGAKVQQILMHLVSNAIKFTAIGEVRIFFRQNRNDNEPSTIDLLIGVKDSGLGIAEDKQEEVFRAFHQSDGGKGKKYPGVGLGLSICRHLAMLLKGRLMLESEVGKGSTFSLLLSAVPVAAGIETRMTKNLPDLAGRKVVVVDDVAINRLLLTRWLEWAGAKASCASSGEDCLVMAADELPDAVLMDIVLPGIDGVETTRRLRELAGDHKIYVIALTAADEGNYPKDNFDEFLAKPVSQSLLIETLARNFSLAEPGMNSDAENMRADFSAPEINPAGLLNALINRASNIGLALGRQLIISDAELFQQVLQEIATEYKSENLQKYATMLENHLLEFDVVGLKNCVKKYPKLLEHMALLDAEHKE
jgi:PAS domain S-box-containing protein